MNAILKHSDAIDREQWLKLLDKSPQAAIYLHPSYLDVVAPGWQAIEVWRDNTLLALMPLHVKHKSGFSYALQPAFCQYWGIAFTSELETNAYKHFSHLRKVVKTILEAFPQEIKWFLYGFAPEFDYPHPFHWAGFQLKVRYTYRLDLAAGFEALEKEFGSDTRYDIRKAAAAGLQVEETSDWKPLLELISTNADAGKTLLKPAELETFKRLAPFLLEQQLGFLLQVKDNQEELLGAALFGSFAGKTAYLVSAQSPTHKSSGAMSLLLSKAIEKACAKDRIFDFEGSMMEGIEGFFRGFGGRPVPYLMIEKNDLPLFVRWIRKLR